MSDLQKFMDLPFDDAAANTVGQDDQKIIGISLAIQDVRGSGHCLLLFTRHERDAYPALRAMDVHILHQVAKTLPGIRNDDHNATIIDKLFNHGIMNTLEGLDALEEYIRGHFAGGPVGEKFRCDYGSRGREYFAEKWKDKHGDPPPITPAEYGVAEALPVIPPMPQPKGPFY